MDKLFEWIKKNPKKAIGIVVAGISFLSVGIPIIIHIAFKIAAPYDFFEAEWEAGNVLEYYGAILGFFGTVALSALALYQNYEIKKESDARQALLEQKEYEKEMPWFSIKNLSCSGNYGNLNLSILNASDNVAHDLEVSNFKIEDAEGVCICESKQAKLRRSELLGNAETEIEFTNDGISGENIKIVFQIKCKDKFRKLHTYSASYQIENAKRFSGKPAYKIIEL